VIKELGHGTGKNETFLIGILSNSDMNFVKVMKKNSLLMDLLDLSSRYEPYIF